MDCLTAQGLISDALDHEPLDGARLTEAKEHCAGCPTCSVFVRTLLLVRSATLPEPPADLADRVMLAIRAEAAAEMKRAEESLAEETAGDPGQRATDDSATPSGESQRGDAPSDGHRNPGAPMGRIRDWIESRSAREAIGWASAAVIFAVTVGVSASVGVRMITSPVTVADTQESDTMSAKSAAPQVAPEASDLAAGTAPTAAAAGSYVTAHDVVFVLSGPSSIATSGLTATDTVASGFGAGPIKSVPSFTSTDPDRLYLFDDATKQLLVFNRVVRSYAGTQYQLTSAPLSDYGQWPALPQNIATPTGSDGSPTFVVLTTDPTGTKIYTLADSGAEAGIAIGPGTVPTDPAAGNPNWTWWTPVR